MSVAEHFGKKVEAQDYMAVCEFVDSAGRRPELSESGASHIAVLTGEAAMSSLSQRGWESLWVSTLCGRSLDNTPLCPARPFMDRGL